MGMTIDELQKYINALRKCAKEHDNDTTYTGYIIVSDLCRDTANLLETAKAILKADYEARLKADMVAMLTDIQLEIEEKEQYYQDKFLESENGVHDLLMGGRMYGCGVCKELIQQKIDALREVVKEKPKSCSTCRSYKGHAGHCEICHEMSMYKEKSEDKG